MICWVELLVLNHLTTPLVQPVILLSLGSMLGSTLPTHIIILVLMVLKCGGSLYLNVCVALIITCALDVQLTL